MKVFVTGATGFAGSHTAIELLEHGHSVRLLARNPQALKQHFDRLGYTVDDIVQADMTDVDAMKQAMQDCDGVVHVAALVDLDPKNADRTYNINMQGVRAVVGGACALGLKHIVYVCSMSALATVDAEIVTENTTPAPPPNPYARSKQDADAYVRDLQRQGHPVQLVYPSAIIGPHDPKLCESNGGLITFASSVVPLTSSGFQVVDVRDLAVAHRYLLENPPQDNFENGRYIIGGNYYPWAELHAILQRITGRKIKGVKVPGVVFRVMGGMLDAVRRVLPFQTQLTAESAQVMTQWVPASSEKYLNRSGNTFRSGEETFGDALRSLAEDGYMPRKYVGKLL